MLLTEKNADLHALLICLDNIRCKSTSTLISWAAGVADLIYPLTSINTRKSSAMKARLPIFINPRSCMTIQDAKTVSGKIDKGAKKN